ncbi:AsmA family protein [Fulvimarina endophytica]|uniref:AsmA family protein n=1 Tax=Fulvimarina endophytica TaxID=2293836 RepID=A0A371WY98_9HYPH|nr:AsmA family protein [Fulvimarina endophytica]RFC61929.1 AsmA family protein [Fulvimarina endophytica]
MAHGACCKRGRRPLARAFVLFGGLLVLALCAALIAPLFIDWSAYRADFEREASRILGREVHVAGTASARLLPFPSVTFEDVTVAGESGAAILTVDEFRMNAELAPFLSGEIRIFAMALDRPVLSLGEGAFALPDLTLPTNADVVLESVEIHDGAIRFASDGRMAEIGIARIEGLEAEFSAGSLRGPFSGSGRFALPGKEAVGFDLTAGEIDPAAGGALRLSFLSQDYPARLDLDGRVTEGEAGARFDGAFSYVQPAVTVDAEGEAQGQDGEEEGGFASLAGIASGPDDTEADREARNEPAPVRAGGSLALAAGSLASETLRVEIGGGETPYVLTGDGRIETAGGEPRFALSLEGETFDVDAVTVSEARSSFPRAGSEAALPSVSPVQRLNALRALLSAVPRPPIDGTAKIAMPVVRLGDTTIRSLAFEASPAENGWTIAGFRAELPGRTLLEADGHLRLGTDYGFAGNLLLASRQPSGLSDWLTGRVEPKIRDLSRAGFAARVDLDPDRQVFEDLELDLGGEVLTGRIERLPDPAGGRLTARLSGGEVDLEALRALGVMLTGSDDLLAGIDRYDVALSAGPVRYSGVEAARVEADVFYDGSLLSIPKIEVSDLAGASFSATGRVDGVLAGETAGQISYRFEATDPAPFFALLDRLRPDTPLIAALRARAGELGPLDASGEIRSIDRASGPASLLVSLKGTAAGTEIEFSSAIENGLEAIRTSGRVGLELHLANAVPARLLSQLGIDAEEGHLDGPLEIESSISASARGPAVVSATVSSPSLKGSLESVLDLTASSVEAVDASLRLKGTSLGGWLDALRLDLGLDDETRDGLSADLSASLALKDSTWRIFDLAGTIGDRSVESDLSLGPDGAVLGRVRASEVSLGWLAGLVYGAQPLAGEGIWSRTPFAASLLPDRPIAIDVRTDRLAAEGLTLEDAAMTVSSSARELAVGNLKGRLAGGDVSGGFVLRNLGGLGSLSADLRADEMAMERLAPEFAVSGAGSDLTVTARLDGTGQSAAGLVSALTGAGEVTAAGIVLPGIPASPMGAILSAADKEGFVAAEDTGTVLSSLSDGPGFPVDRLASGYSVTAGEAVLPPVALSVDGGGELTLSGRLDLRDLDLDADLALVLDPGDEAIEGTQALVAYSLEGPLDRPVLSRSSTALENYLAVRALDREQARVEAMQERLEETLRLRREARFYRWLERDAEERARRAAEEAEARAEAEVQAERQRAEDAARAQAEARAAAEARARAEAQAQAEAQAEAEAAARAVRSAPEPMPRPAPPAAEPGPSAEAGDQPARSSDPVRDLVLDFGADPNISGDIEGDRGGASGLPGVGDPLRF